MNKYSGRKYIIIAIVSLVCLIFIVRLFYIQVIDDTYKLDAKNQAFRYVTQFPVRGYIFDRNGKLLVFNEAAYDLMVLPKQVKEIDTASFCSLLGITKDLFERKMLKAIQAPNSPRKPSVFEKQISAETYAKLQEKLYKYPGFYVQPRTLRKYPKKIAGHLLGYIGEANKSTTEADPYYKEGDYLGISGIEKSYETELRGVKGTKIVMVDVHNREKGSFQNGLYDTLPIPGKPLTSSLDADLQLYGEQLMRNKTGGIVALDPSTGEILACITSPAYDPNLLVGRERSNNYAKLLVAPGMPLFNRALMAYYPPGSTFKLINDLIGRQEGVLFPNTSYYCDGGYHMGRLTVKCDARHGSLNLISAIAHSCNTYHCYVFRSIVDNKKFKTTEEGYRAWRNHVLTFGIGKRLYSDLPQELRGMVPSVEYYDKYFGKGSWKSSTVVSLSIGQGELGITPLQMANTMCIIANHGYYYIPHIIKKINNSEKGLEKFKVKQYTDVDSSYFNEIIDGMESVVESGTAAASKVEGIRICGKTGTAQNPHKDHSLFVAFAPRENPKIAIGIMVENGGWGASWAAPIATLMIEKYLTGTIKRIELEKKMLEGVVPTWAESQKEKEVKK